MDGEAVLQERFDLVLVQGAGDGPVVAPVGEVAERERHVVDGGQRSVRARAEHHGAVVTPPRRHLHGVAMQAALVIDRHGDRHGS